MQRTFNEYFALYFCRFHCFAARLNFSEIISSKRLLECHTICNEMLFLSGFFLFIRFHHDTISRRYFNADSFSARMFGIHLCVVESVRFLASCASCRNSVESKEKCDRLFCYLLCVLLFTSFSAENSLQSYRIHDALNI